MPQSVFVYWATNNSISIMQTLVMKNKAFRSYLEILDPPPPDPNAPKPASPFSEISKVLNKTVQFTEFECDSLSVGTMLGLQ